MVEEEVLAWMVIPGLLSWSSTDQIHSWNIPICTYLRTSKVTTWIEDDIQDDIEFISFTRSCSSVSALFQSFYSFHFMVQY